MPAPLDLDSLLDRLEVRSADSLEGQTLDFKEWSSSSMKDGVDQLVEASVCMANGDGGYLVYGVNDKAVGRTQSLVGVPAELDVAQLIATVQIRTEPSIALDIREITVPFGTGRILVVTVPEGLKPCTDSAGRAKIRVGRECRPFTGSLRQAALVAINDFTAELIAGDPRTHLSAAALERLRDTARFEGAPDEFVIQTDLDLLGGVGLLRDGCLTRAGLLLAGREQSIRTHIPAYVAESMRMSGDTDYVDRNAASDAIPLAIARLLDRIMVDNPITTLQQPLFHLEYRTYPELALREALANSFCHADYRLASPILVKTFDTKLEISNPGTFVGGITAENILHHPPTARNPHLVDAMSRLRLVNRANLGISRMYQSLLIEGKEPPVIQRRGATILLTFLAGNFSPVFRAWVAAEERSGRSITVDHLLILRFLLRHQEIDQVTAARICQRSESETREILSSMAHERGYLERGGTGRGTYHTMALDLYIALEGPGNPERHNRIAWDAAKTRIISVLRSRALRGEDGLANAEIRQITHLDREQSKRLMAQLRTEGAVLTGRGRGARWVYRGRTNDTKVVEMG
jgi:ATP-dependent DNA helicase RecG